jgi:radical SAM protein with 4Fe4S-binding SPASM domain
LLKEAEMNKKRPGVIVWYCTTSCEYRCRHCWRYESRHVRELDTSEAKKLIRHVAEADPRLLVFSGGEPLLRKDIFELFEFAREQGLNIATDVRTAQFDDEVAQALARNQVHACITMDAMSPDITDTICGFKGAHERLMQTIKLCERHGVEFGFNTAVQQLNADEVTAITQWANEIGATTHHISMLIPLGKAAESYASMCLDSSSFIKCLNDIYQEEQKQGTCNVVVYEPTYLPFVKEAGGVLPNWGRVCKIGEYLHIDVNGHVLPCTRATSTVGSALEKPLLEIYEEMASSPFFSAMRNHENLKEPCASCKYGEICGGCRIRAHALTGDWFAADPVCPYKEREEVIS